MTPPGMQNTRLRQALRRLVVGEDAVAITEYAMLVAFVAIAVVGVLSIFGSQIGTWLGSKTGTITTV